MTHAQPAASPSPEVRRARTMFLWVGLIVPVLLLALSAAVIAAWLPDLPDPVAIHWGTEGVDGFAPRPAVFLELLIGLGVVLLCAVLALFAHRMPQSQLARDSGSTGVVADAAGQPQWSATARLLGGMNLGLGAFIAVLAIGTTAVQRGLADASDAPDIDGWLLAAFPVLVVVAAAGWLLQPRVEPRVPLPAQADAAAPLGDEERAAWFGSVSIARVGRIVLGCGLLMTLVMTAFVLAQVPEDGITAAGWILIGTSVLLVLLVACGLVFRVRVGAQGLQVRSLMGWPSTRIPLERIADVRVTRIDPFAEFGGWGWRVSTDGRRGVVLRAGEALQVTRTDGRVFVVTIDGASEAAAVLQALRDRGHRIGMPNQVDARNRADRPAAEGDR